MKIRDGFLLKEVAGKHIVVAVGEQSVDFSGVISLNLVGAFLWTLLESETDEKALLDALLEKYDVDEATAKADIAAFLCKAREKGFLE